MKICNDAPGFILSCFLLQNLISKFSFLFRKTILKPTEFFALENDLKQILPTRGHPDTFYAYIFIFLKSEIQR